MGLFDFDLNDQEKEIRSLHEISSDKGKTWVKQWATPSEVLMYRMDGCITRSFYISKTIKLCLDDSTRMPIIMTIAVPHDRDPEEYIDERLEYMMNDDLRYNCEWEFV